MYAKKLLVAGVALGFGAVALGQEYFDFGQIRGLPGRPAVQFELNPALLGFVRETARNTDPATADLLNNIEGVQVRVYNAIENAADLAEYLDEATDRLQRANWQQIVHVEDEEQVRIFMQGTETSITGLAAMIVGDQEAVFVSVAGSISPEQLAQLMARAGAEDFLESLGELNVPQP